MKKSIAILLAALAFLIAGCGNENLSTGMSDEYTEVAGVEDTLNASVISYQAAPPDNPIYRSDATASREEVSEDLPALSVETLIEANPIDMYFLEKAHLLVPTTTPEMVIFGQIAASAWFAEMENNYEILRNSTGIESVRELIDEERYSFIEYIKNRAELELLFTASTAFEDGWEDLVVGSIGRVLRMPYQGDGWRAKTAELFERLDRIGITPQFIFDEEKYDEKLRQALPELWDRAHANDLSS